MQRAIIAEPANRGVYASREQLWPQIQAFLWIVVATAVGFYGNGKHDILTVARHHPDVWREAYYVGVVGIGINIGIFFYLAFWTTSVTALDSAQPFEPGSSAAIHIGTAAGIMAILALVSAFWEIWNVLTPVIMFILFMGFIMSVQLFPSWLLPFKALKQASAKAE